MRPKDKSTDSLYAILRGMIREEIDATPGFSELTGVDMLPASLDAERTILGAILLDNEAFKKTSIRSDEFAHGAHQHIFGCMAGLISKGCQADLVTVAEELMRRKEIDISGGVAYLSSLLEGLPQRLAITEYVEIVREKARLRRIMYACQDAIAQAQEQQKNAGRIVTELGIALKGIRKA